jgi:hypothetical protein
MQKLHWGIPLFTLVDEENTRTDNLGLSTLSGAYGVEGDDGAKCIVVFQSLELANEYIRSHPTAPRSIATVETPYDAITAFQPVFDAGWERVAFFRGSGRDAVTIELSELLQQVRKTIN